MTTNLESECMVVDPSEWGEEYVPEEARKLALEETAQGIPTAIGFHPILGWVVFQTSGQGPYLIWQSPEST